VARAYRTIHRIYRATHGSPEFYPLRLLALTMR
jgi:hypothetical protein